MSTRLLRHVRQLVVRPAADSAGDAALLERWVLLRDEAAFAALVSRHGPMVLRVCRNILADAHSAEDALQATFLVLARRAASVRPATAVAAWLFGVARRVALKARTAEGRRRVPRGVVASAAAPQRAEDPLDRLSARELLALVDEEVARLPERYRLPVVVCCLEGRSVEESARLLGWTAGSVKGRLERGRRLLRTRLARRGVELAALLAVGLAGEGVSAGLPAVLVAATAGAAAAFTAGRPAEDSGAEALARDVLRRGVESPLRTVSAVLVAVAVAAGAGALRGREPADDPPPAAAPKANAGGGAAPGVDRFGDPLPAGAVARLGTVRLRPGAKVFSLAFSPDGKTLAAVSWCPGIYLYDVATGKQLRHFGTETNDSNVAWSPDGKSLAAFSRDKSIRLRDVATGREIRRFVGHDQFGVALAFSPDGKVLASGAQDATVRLWDTSTGAELRCLRDHEQPVRNVAWSGDGKTLASGGFDTTIRLWDASTGGLLRRLAGHASNISRLAWSADGKHLASGSNDGTARWWDAAAGKEVRVFGNDADKMLGPPGKLPRPKRFIAPGDGVGMLGIVRGVVLTPDGKSLVTGGVNHETVMVWDIATGRERSRTAVGDRVMCLALSADGKTLAIGSTEGQIDLQDLATGRLLHRFEGHPGRAFSVAWSPDGKTLVSGGPDGACYWDTRTWRPAGRREGPGDDSRYTLFSPDGKVVASGGHGSTLWLWDRVTGKELLSLEGDQDERNRPIALSPGGKKLAAFFGGLGVWDVATGEKVLIDTGGERSDGSGKNSDAVFSPDGRTVTAASTGGVVLCEAASGKVLRRFGTTAKPEASTVLLSPDGRNLFAAAGPAVSLWEVATGKERRSFKGHRTNVAALALSPSGRILASAGGGPNNRSDDSVRLWDVATGMELRRLTGHRNIVSGVAFAPDGKTVASASNDGTVLVWDISDLVPDRLAGPEGASPESLEALWSDLAGDDAAAAHRSLWTLAADPERAVPLLRRHLRAAALPADAERVRRLIAELDGDDFETRERASKQLRELGDAVEPVLRQTLAGSPPAETRRRLELLIADLEGPVTSPEALRAVRGVELLERCGTRAARQLLETLAAGTPLARTTHEAKASLARLEALTATRP